MALRKALLATAAILVSTAAFAADAPATTDATAPKAHHAKGQHKKAHKKADKKTDAAAPADASSDVVKH